MAVYYVTRPRLSLMFFQPVKVCILEQLINVAATKQHKISSSFFFVKISEQMTNFFSMTRVLFGLLIFFAKLCLKVGGAPYTQVFTVPFKCA